MTFGEKVKELRTQHGWSQTELAHRIGVSLRTVASYESGRSYPKKREVYDFLAKELEVDVNFLRTEEEEFMTEVGAQYGARGVKQAQNILNQTAELFAGGSLDPDDEIAFVQEVQRIYLDSKKEAKKFTPKKYLKKQQDE